ncbi:GNAT family N-acetyltransferase [Roseateles depolymerans]|uniref:Uncharacterized protein n=1 Tax=Roseateles depolymerans TaxID=76731 RepID=A0A0U3MWL1_9BURK|nr:GNAT family N-acetyltransferase [Roseateles depolymerans]ALV07411.1 hypothetical protein RD2015_2949 [Roseateles depolymerans]REG22375.1 RimJ/RimL family protein N-acetyltransferase [Roseateles depolymerans]
MTTDAKTPDDYVTLESQTRAHAGELFEVLQDLEIYKHISDTPPLTLESFSKRLQALEVGGSPDGTEKWLNWVVRHREGQLLGYVQATIYEPAYADVAYVLASKFWGQDFAYKATLQMLYLLHVQHAVQTAYAVTCLDNNRSMRLLARLGFQRIGHEDYPGEAPTSAEAVWRKSLTTR